MYCIENKQMFNKVQVMYIQLFENIGAGPPSTNGQFFLCVFNTYPLSNSFQIVTAIKLSFKTIADG